jgi:hypothetical protein
MVSHTVNMNDDNISTLPYINCKLKSAKIRCQIYFCIFYAKTIPNISYILITCYILQNMKHFTFFQQMDIDILYKDTRTPIYCPLFIFLEDKNPQNWSINPMFNNSQLTRPFPFPQKYNMYKTWSSPIWQSTTLFLWPLLDSKSSMLLNERSWFYCT